ncbi:MAG: hypothetical protein JO080_07235 [Mucilaginibacter sp.]|nr:hypothetical protein [Mucilaginibacter sp.]
MKNEVCQNELIDMIIDLQERGFDHDFVINHEYICCLQYNAMISPEDFDILETHACVNNQHVCGDYILYGIRLKNHDIKGILLSSHKSYNNDLSFPLWQKFENEIVKSTHKLQPFMQRAS